MTQSTQFSPGICLCSSFSAWKSNHKRKVKPTDKTDLVTGTNVQSDELTEGDHFWTQTLVNDGDLTWIESKLLSLLSIFQWIEYSVWDPASIGSFQWHPSCGITPCPWLLVSNHILRINCHSDRHHDYHCFLRHSASNRPSCFEKAPSLRAKAIGVNMSHSETQDWSKTWNASWHSQEYDQKLPWTELDGTHCTKMNLIIQRGLESTRCCLEDIYHQRKVDWMSRK
jgi:hypothetical protein